MNISIGARTDVGGRSNNEDCLAVLDRERVPLRADAVLIIADGMGGRANGEEASGIAVKIVRETLMELLNPSNEKPLPPAEDILSAAMRRANSSVYELAQENPDTPGMGTTCIAAIISEGILTLAHVGDSRAYLIRGSTIKPLTKDHTYVADQVKAGNMSNDAAKSSRFRNVITRAIGIAPTVQPDFEIVPLLDSDTVLLCTDGLSNTLNEIEILDVVANATAAQGTANSLLEAAKDSGVRDNVTVIAVRVAADVQSSRLKRNGGSTEGNGSRTNEGAKPKPEARPGQPARPIPPKFKRAGGSSSQVEKATLICFSAVAGALATIAVLMLFANLKIAGLNSSFSPVSDTRTDSSTNRPDYLSLRYQPPAQIFFKPIRPNFLLMTDNGVFVALAESGRIVHLNSLGQPDGQVPPDAIAPEPGDTPTYYAVDPDGNLYESYGWSGTISQVSSDGTTRRQVVSSLTKPEAIAVDGAGDIYVIDNNELFEARTISDSETP